MLGDSCMSISAGHAAWPCVSVFPALCVEIRKEYSQLLNCCGEEPGQSVQGMSPLGQEMWLL